MSETRLSSFALKALTGKKLLFCRLVTQLHASRFDNGWSNECGESKATSGNPCPLHDHRTSTSERSLVVKQTEQGHATVSTKKDERISVTLFHSSVIELKEAERLHQEASLAAQQPTSVTIGLSSPWKLTRDDSSLHQIQPFSMSTVLIQNS